MTINESTAEAAARKFNAGEKLAGCYTLKEILPFEVPGVVWLAHDEELDKDLNLYFLPDAVVGDARAMNEIKQEARRNRQIVHPRILRIHDLIEEDNWAAITMDHMEGQTLAAVQKQKDKGVLGASEIAPLLAQVCGTLEDAHKIDLLHRDLAPENVLLLKTGGAMLMNFGISRAILDSLSRSGQKVHGDGNLAFMSPQQLDGERASKWDDIYSLGAVIYNLLTGQPPFYKGELISQIRKAVPPPMSERRAELGSSGEAIPKSWEKVVAECLDKHPAQRPKSAAEVQAKLASDKVGAAVSPAKSPVEATQPDRPQPDEANKERKTTPSSKKGRGPAKTPVITEATVVSQTSVDKGEPEGDQPAADHQASSEGPKRGATTPSGFPLGAFVEMDPAASANRKSSGPAVIATLAAILAVGGLIAYFVAGDSKKEADFGPADSSETDMHSAVNVSEGRPEKPVAVVQPAASATATPKSSPMLAAPNNPTARTMSTIATPPAVAAGETLLTRATQEIAQKEKALAAAREQLAAAEKNVAERNNAQQAADAAVQEVMQNVQSQTAAAAEAKKSADAAAAALKQREEAMRKAEAEASEAQKVAVEKARLVTETRKAAAETAQTVKQQQEVAEKIAAQSKETEQRIAERQRLAAEAAKAAAAENQSRQKIAADVQKANADLAAAKAEVARLANTEATRKAAEEAERVRAAREGELKKIADQAAAAAKAAADAQKALQDAQRQFDEAAKRRQEAQKQAEEAAKGALTVTPPVPEPTLPSSSPSANASAPPETALAMNTRPNPKTPSVTAVVGKTVDQRLENSLGLKFAPVGNVLFSVWLTRVQDFAAFAKATGYRPTGWMQPGFRQGADHPVVNVSWNDAMAFCKWLSEKEQKEGLLSATQSYRLPTDLEWSKAVGLPEETGRTPESRDMEVPNHYPWGTQWPPPAGAGNYTGEETGSDVAIKGYDDGFAWTSPVGSFPANRYGLYDMGGNVWQWCVDWLNDEHKAKVLRGGSWYNGALRLSLLSSARVYAAPDVATDSYGFRVVVATDATKPQSKR